MSAKEGIVTLEDLRFGYRKAECVIDSVQATVEPGRVHALIGPNASGKSTLIKLMLGVLPPWQGKVHIEGQPVRALRPARRAALLSYVPQRSGVSFAFTVREVVEMGRFTLEKKPAAIDTALQACELEHLARRLFSELSVGQQQRVLLARAMGQASGEGKVMLLDEPVSAMDLEHVHRTMSSLRTLAEEGLAVVIVLQDINLAARYADRIWLLSGGRLVASGEWQDVLVPAVLEPVYNVKLKAVYRRGQEEQKEKTERPFYDVGLA